MTRGQYKRGVNMEQYTIAMRARHTSQDTKVTEPVRIGTGKHE